MTVATKSGIARAAAGYLARGWSLLPIRARDKRPLLPWERLRINKPTAAEVTDWFRRWPHANIGIVTGEISNLVVLDIDPEHGGNDSLDRLQQRFGAFPRTVEATTGGGGRHLYFLHPDVTVHNRAGLAQGIDVRGDGGYVVAPPSIHPTGAQYYWTPGHSPEELTLAPLPRWLLRTVGARAGRSLVDWRRLVAEDVPQGQRNSTIASLTGHLLWHRVDPAIVLELLLAWNRLRCRPPLEDKEVVQVVESITHLHQDEADLRASLRSSA